MNKKIKRFVSTALSAISGLSLFACTPDSNVVKGLPDYSADEASKVFMIGGYCAPHKGVFEGGTADYITEKSYLEMKECGLDYILTLYEQGPTNPDILRHLEHAQTAGIKVLLQVTVDFPTSIKG